MTVTAQSGAKTITLTGSGPHAVTLTDVEGGAVAVGEAVVNAVRSWSDVVATGALTLSASQAAAGPWSLLLSGEDDTITLDEAIVAFVDMGNGNDSFSLTDAPDNPNYPYLMFGTGQNNATLGCQNPVVDYANNTPYTVESIGALTLGVVGCSVTVNVAPQGGSNGDLSSEGAISVTIIEPGDETAIFQNAPYPSFDVTGSVSGSTTILLDTMVGRQQGPATIDVDMTDAQLVFGPQGPRSIFSLTMDPDLNRNSPGPDLPSSFPTTVTVDTSDIVGSGADSYVVSSINYPTQNQTLAYTGGGTGSRLMLLFFEDPATHPNIGVPTLTADTPVELIIGTKNCWGLTLHARAGSGFPDVSHPAGSCVYSSTVNVPAVSNNIGAYEGVTLFAPSGQTLQLGFNGGSFANGDTLTISRVSFGDSSKDDNASAGGAN